LNYEKKQETYFFQLDPIGGHFHFQF